MILVYITFLHILSVPYRVSVPYKRGHSNISQSNSLINLRHVTLQVLRLLIRLYEAAPTPDWVNICQCLMFLDDPQKVAGILDRLLKGSQVSHQTFSSHNAAMLVLPVHLSVWLGIGCSIGRLLCSTMVLHQCSGTVIVLAWAHSRADRQSQHKGCLLSLDLVQMLPS